MIDLETTEGHLVSMDPETHAGLMGLDVDLSRLCVVDDEVRVYRKSRDELHGLTLEALADLIAPPPAKVAAPAPMVPVAPKPKARPRHDIEAILGAIPVTGKPSGMLARGTGGGLPPLWINGKKTRATPPDTSTSTVRVPLADSRGSLVGWCALSREAYLALRQSPHILADSIIWAIDNNGIVSMRCRARRSWSGR